ncbi:glycosyltransferase involved in cell wall biosynthesis [Streptomyces sp. SLBN-118]|uniref:glycosyltransferase family 4 protein n=1 Tax=Streptomyces sp. SLBN-118 TaxID=2768454 RepID=UPI00114ED5DB|nr:glycosyltransferase family 4 protein [Streptomyces sp. SLBN-118]TQK42393.1 glycosyltransferase involved in cell wall biosynthesis [Streptomyces sp. SLBN-118]
MKRRLRIALIASARHPIREPFAGGLEAHTWSLASSLVGCGHDVTLFAAPGSDPALGVHEIRIPKPAFSAAARSDVSMTDPQALAEHHAYLRLMVALSREEGRSFDLVHNNSLHYLPVAMAPAVHAPVLTTLHTPPTPWLESAIQTDATCSGRFSAVSAHTARAWRPLVPGAQVIHNGIDTSRWRPGPGGGDLVWFGRIVAEKGPQLAIEAARRAGRSLLLAGPLSDPHFFRESIVPLLDGDIRYVGHLGREALVRLVGGAAVVLVTPCWDEPYGLVVAEALSCGTPVCGFDRGALHEILSPECGLLVPFPDVDALAEAVDVTAALSRRACRQRAERFCSLGLMTERYERLYEELIA